MNHLINNLEEAAGDGVDAHLKHLSQIRDTDKAKDCPECKSIEFKQAFDGERECKGCGQSWYADVDYSFTWPLNMDDVCTGCGKREPEAGWYATFGIGLRPEWFCSSECFEKISDGDDDIET